MEQGRKRSGYCDDKTKWLFKVLTNLRLFFRLQKQYKAATDFLANEMGQTVNRASRDKIPINLTKDEIQLYIKRFQIIDKDNKGYVSINDIRRGLKVRSWLLCIHTFTLHSSMLQWEHLTGDRIKRITIKIDKNLEKSIQRNFNLLYC